MTKVVPLIMVGPLTMLFSARFTVRPQSNFNVASEHDHQYDSICNHAVEIKNLVQKLQSGTQERAKID